MITQMPKNVTVLLMTCKVLQIACCLDNVGNMNLVVDASTKHVANTNLSVCHWCW